MNADELNAARYVPGTRRGHYESFFLRANHPSRPQAFWIRYTLFSPRRRPADAIGELWAIWFDGESGRHTAVKSEVPIVHCRFARSGFEVAVGAAELGARALHGSIVQFGRTVSWDLGYDGGDQPVLLLPERLYAAGVPKAKSLVALPMARFRGFVVVGDAEHEIDDWVGSQNHNWGSQHTEQYEWGQVAGFDSHPSGFLEVATARVRVGPLLLPQMTILVLRLGDQEYRLNDVAQALRAHASIEGFEWKFVSETSAVRIEGKITAGREAFVGLRYNNPPGGIKHCLNTKIASCELHVTDKSSGITEVLATANRAAFEILTDRRDHGIEVRA